MTHSLWKLPDGWEWATFNDTARVESNLVDPSEYPDYPHIAPNHIESKTGRLLEYGTISEDGVTSPKHLFKPGHVIYSKIRPYLAKAALVDFEGLCSADMYPVGTELNPNFLHKWLISSSFTELAARNQGRTVLPKINQRALGVLSVPVPPLNEQRRIGAKLEALQRRARRTRAALDAVPPLLEKFRQSVLAAAFRGDLTADWRARNPDVEPASVLLERIREERRRRWEEAELAKMEAKGKVPKDDRWKRRYKEPVTPEVLKIPSIPASWGIASLDQILSALTSGSRGWSKYYNRGMGVFLLAKNVRPGRLDLSVIQRVNPPERDPERFRTRVEKGDVLVTIVGANTGDVCCVPRSLPEHYVCQSVGLLRPVRECMGKYLMHFLNSSVHGGKQFEEFMYGQGRPHLSFDQIKSVYIPVPPIEEQFEIIRRLEAALEQTDALRSGVSTGNDAFAKLEQSILAKAFRGDLVPQDPTDEPAAKLLERIRAARPEKPKQRRRPRKAKKPPTPQPTADATNAQKPDARTYTAADWRRVVLACLGDDAVERADAVRACAWWAGENLDLRFQRLRRDGVIVRGLEAAIDDAIERGELERVGSSSVRKIVDGGRDDSPAGQVRGRIEE